MTRFGFVLLLGLIVPAPLWAGGPAPLKLQGTGTGHTARIYRGVFTPDSKTFLSVGIDAVVRAWNVADGKPAYTLAGHTGPIHGVGLAGERMLITGAESGELLLWDLPTRKKIGKLGKTQHSLHCLAVSHDGKIVATGGGEWKETTPGELRLWNLETREEIVLLKGHRRLLLGIAFSPDDQLLAAVDYSGDLHIWNLVTRKPVVTLFLENPAGAVAFSPDGKFLVVGDYRGRLNVWDTSHWLDEGVVHAHWGGVMWLKYAPRGNMLASAGWDGSIKIWNGHDVEATPPVRVGEHPDKAWMVAFSPDAKTLASAGEDRLVKFWAITPEFTDRYAPAPVKPVAVPMPARKGDARIALIATHPLESARTLQDLALVALSKEDGIALLQRDAIEKILAEQKLNNSGLVDAKSAVQLGKILAVDLVGVIDVSPEAKEPMGFVVFDAATGARLHDDGFAKEKIEQQIRGIAKGVQTSVQKWRAGAKQLKTVCMLPVRNADLPRGMDVYCEAIGATLERQLVHHPRITTLERKWLDSVNQEKTIASEALSRELLASVLVVDLEIARGAKGKGVRGTVTVRDNAGKMLHNFAHQVNDDQGADLLAPMMQRLHVALDTTQGSTLSKPSREARRFARETDMLWKHKHFRQALQAAEAAYALMPDDEMRVRLAECLLQYPREMWRKESAIPQGKKFLPVERTAEEVRAGLSMVRRGQQLIDSAKSRVDDLPDHLKYWSLAESGPCFYADIATSQALREITIVPADPSVKDDIADFRKTCLLRDLDRLKEIAALKKRTPIERLQRLTPGLRSNYVSQFAEFGKEAAARNPALREAARIWLDLSVQISAEQFPLEQAAWFADSVLNAVYGRRTLPEKMSAADEKAATALLTTLINHPHPLMQAYGKHYRMKYELTLEKIAPPEADRQFLAYIDEAKRSIDQAPAKNPTPYRIAFYEFLKVALTDAPPDISAKEIDDAYAGLVDYMLERKDIAGHAGLHILTHKIMERNTLFTKLQMVRGFKEMYDAPQHRVFHDPTKDLPKQFKYYESMILKFDATLTKKAPEVPWDKVIRLAEADLMPNVSRFFKAVRHEERVYFLAGVWDPGEKNQTYVQLHRVGLEGGTVQAFGRVPITPRGYNKKDPRYAFSHESFVPHSIIHGKHFIAGTAHDGILVYPLEGGTPDRYGDKEGLPAMEVTALAALDNQVFAALDGGYLVQIDLATRRVDVLASSRRVNKLSPFDNDRPFFVRNMLADPDRQRVLFPLGLASFNHPNVGMWEYNLKTQKFKKHLPIPWFQFSTIKDGFVYLDHNQRQWLGKYDLAKDKFTLLQGKVPNGMDKQAPAGLPKGFAARFPDRFFADGFIWESNPFQRRSLATDKEVLLTHPRFEFKVQVLPHECLEPIRPDEILFGDRRGLYLVKLKK